MVMKAQTLIMDLDDTLVHCNKYFKETIDRFVEVMQSWFNSLNKEEIKEVQLKIDLASVKEYGLSSSRFPESLAETYEYFCKKTKRDINEAHIDQVREIGQSVFEIKVQPLPYMYEVLNQLRDEGHHLYLFTGGDEENQSRKIAQLELETYFDDRIFIYEHKNTQALEEVIQTIQASKDTTWMIGNSLKTDIKPALEIGIRAVHIPSEIEWDFNQIELDVQSNDKFYNLDQLKDLPSFIRTHSAD